MYRTSYSEPFAPELPPTAGRAAFSSAHGQASRQEGSAAHPPSRTLASGLQKLPPRDFLIFAILFGLLLLSAAPSVTWYDTGELTATAFLLGNGHPTGQPLFTLLGKASSLIPLGSLTFRLILLSVACTALTGVFLLRLLSTLLSKTGTGFLSMSVGWFLLGLLGALPIWLQAGRVEVYALQLLMVAGCLMAVTSPHRRGNNLLVGAFLFGLAAANHPLLATLALPGLWVWIGWPGARPLARLVAAAILGGTLYLYGPIRAASSALMNWGDPDRLARWWPVITGQAYRRSFSHLDLEQALANLLLHAQLLQGVLGAAWLVLALLGLWKLRKSLRTLLGFGLLVLLNIYATAGQSVFSAENPDALGYLALSVALVGLLSAVGLAFCLEKLETLAPRLATRTFTGWALPSVGLLLGSLPALKAWPGPDFHQAWENQRFARDLLHDIPPGALYLPAGDSTSFAALYGQVIEGRRPDVLVLPVYTLPDRAPYFRPDPDAEKLLNHLEGPEGVDALLVNAQRSRAVVISANDLPLRANLRLRPGRQVFRLIGPEEVEPLDAQVPTLLREYEALSRTLTARPPYLRDRQARLSIPSHLEAAGDFLVEQGVLLAARQLYAQACAMDPDQSRLVRLKKAELERRLIGIKSHYQASAPPDAPLQLALAVGDRTQARALLAPLSGDSPALLRARARLARLEGSRPALTSWLLALHARDALGEEAREALIELSPWLEEVWVEEWLTASLKRWRDPRLVLALAQQAWRRGELERAWTLSRGATQVAPNLVEGWVIAGQVALARGELLAARDSLRAAEALAPADPIVLKLASALYRRGVR